jgi:uncharacterized protein YndB with AHSA1/START domain
MIEIGRLRPDGDRCAVRLERLYDATPDELWSALTDAEQLRRWMADVARIDVRPGGEFEFRFGDAETEWAAGRVVSADPPRLLELDWTFPGEPESFVRFEIVPRDAGVLLVLDHAQLDRGSGASYSAGWHAHLDLLDAQLSGAPEPDWLARYQELRPEYDRQARALGWLGPGGFALFAALAEGDEQQARDLAQAQPELREQPDSDGLLPAMRALYTRGRALADALAPPDERLDIFLAAALGRTQRLGELLARDPLLAEAYSPDGFTPLHLACFSGGPDATRVLVEHGAPLEALARNEQVRVRPLGTAAFSGDRASARLLLEAGAEPAAAVEHGFTPLHTAAQNGDAELVRLLLGHGADATAAADDGRTPEDLARAAGHDECLQLLAAVRA